MNKLRKYIVISVVSTSNCVMASIVQAQDAFIYSANIFKAKDFAHQNSDQEKKCVKSVGPGFTSYAAEEIIQLDKGDAIISAPLVTTQSSLSGEVMASEIVVRNHITNNIVGVASARYSSSDFNNPTRRKHLLPVKYTIDSEGLYRIEHRIHSFQAGVCHYRTIAITGNNLDVHVSNGHSTTLSRSFGKSGSVTVAAMLPSGKPATEIRTWRKGAGFNYGHQYFDAMAKFDVKSWESYDSKFRADNEADRPTLFIVKEELEYDWRQIFNDSRQALSTVQEAWSWISFIIL